MILWGVDKTGGWGCGGVGIFEKFPINVREISRKSSIKCSVIRKREIHIVRRQNIILINDLWKNNSTITSGSPVEYLRNNNLNVFQHLFPTPIKLIFQIRNYL